MKHFNCSRYPLVPGLLDHPVYVKMHRPFYKGNPLFPSPMSRTSRHNIFSKYCTNMDVCSYMHILHCGYKLYVTATAICFGIFFFFHFFEVDVRYHALYTCVYVVDYYLFESVGVSFSTIVLSSFEPTFKSYYFSDNVRLVNTFLYKAKRVGKSRFCFLKF